MRMRPRDALPMFGQGFWGFRFVRVCMCAERKNFRSTTQLNICVGHKSLRLDTNVRGGEPPQLPTGNGGHAYKSTHRGTLIGGTCIT